MERSSNKKSKKSESFAMKWKTVRVYPTEHFTNAMEQTWSGKYKIETVGEFINQEVEIQERVFRGMNCDAELSKRAIEAIRVAYESSK